MCPPLGLSLSAAPCCYYINTSLPVKKKLTECCPPAAARSTHPCLPTLLQSVTLLPLAAARSTHPCMPTLLQSAAPLLLLDQHIPACLPSYRVLPPAAA